MKLMAPAFAAWAVLATPAIAQDTQGQRCDPEFSSAAETVNLVGLEIGPNEFARENFGVRVRNRADGQCLVTLRVSRVSSPSLDLPPYLLFQGGQRLDIAPSAQTPSGNSDIDVAASGGSRGNNVPFRIRFPTEWGLNAGTFTDQLRFSLIDASGAEIDQLLVTVNLAVPRSVSVRVVGATGVDDVARIRLGNLSSSQPTRSDPFGVRVWSTSGYSVAFRSTGNGTLVHEDELDRIPYRLLMDRQEVDVATSTPVTFMQHTNSLGELHALEVQVPATRARAGRYSDRVTVTVTAV